MSTQSQITIQDFLGLTNKLGTGTIWGDIAGKIRVENLANDEILGNVFNRKKTQIADTFQFEYQYVPKVKSYDNTVTKSNFIKMEKITMVWDDREWLQSSYTVDIRTVRSAQEWSTILATREKNMYISKNDIDNLIAMETVTDYAIATGRFKVIPDLDSAGATKDKVYDALTNTLETISAIHIAKTDVSWGQSKSRSQLIVSEFVQIQMMKAANFISASDGSFNVFKGGILGSYGGVPYNTSVYLDREDTVDTNDNAWKTFNFKNILGIVFDIDNFTLYTKPPLFTGADGWFQVPTETNLKMRQMIWKTMGILTPAREHLNYLFVRVAPTLAEVNAARARLKAKQPQFYGKFDTLDSAKYNAIITNASVFRQVGGSDTPQDGVPPTKNAVRSGNHNLADKRAVREDTKARIKNAKEEIKSLED